MTRRNAVPSAPQQPPEHWLAVLLLLFVGSGAAALIY